MNSKLRVLFIDCNSILANEQEKCVALAKYPDIELTLLVPEVYKERLRRIQLEKREDPNYKIMPAKLWGKVPNRTLFLNQLKTLIQQKPDIIHITSDENFFLTWQVLLWRNWFSPKSKFIFHSWQNILFDSKNFPQPNRFLYQFDTVLERFIYRHADAAVARNHEVVTVLQQRGFRGPIAEIPWGIDTEKFQPTVAPEIRQKYNLKGTVIGFVGRMVPEKGILDLLEAFLLLNEHGASEEPLTLCLVGDGPLSSEIRTRIQHSSLKESICLIPEIPSAEVAKLLGAFDIFVFPSRTTSGWKEQFGRALVEAMSTQIAVIGSDSGAIPDVIGDAGLIFPEGQIDILSRKIRTLVQNPQQRKQLGIQARKRIQENYTWNRFAEKTRNLFWQLMEQSL